MFEWVGKCFPRSTVSTQCTPGRDACLTGAGFGDEYGEMAYSDYAAIVQSPPQSQSVDQSVDQSVEQLIPWTWPVPTRTCP